MEENEELKKLEKLNDVVKKMNEDLQQEEELDNTEKLYDNVFDFGDPNQKDQYEEYVQDMLNKDNIDEEKVEQVEEVEEVGDSVSIENNENIEEEMTAEELLNKIQDEKEKRKEAEHKKEVEIKGIDRKIEKIKSEIALQNSEKKLGYKAVVEQCEEQIKKLEEEKKGLEKTEEEKSEISKENKIKILTKGKKESERTIRGIELEIRKKQIEAQEAIRNSEMEEKELPDGKKTRLPKVLRINEEIENLKEAVRRQQGLMEKYELNLEELRGVTINKGAQEASERNYEEMTKFFHGQGDLKENKKDDRRANDEYFGLEEVKEINNRRNKNTKERQKDDPRVITPEDPIPEGFGENPLAVVEDKNKDNDKQNDNSNDRDEQNNNDRDENKSNGENEKDDKVNNAIARSGLQVYREILNAGPEPEGKNLWGYGRISELPVVGMFARGLGKFFGSRKFVKETYDNIKELPESDYNLLAEYLTEEKIVELKVPMPILDALLKRHREIQNEFDKENTPKLSETQEKLKDAIRTNDDEAIYQYGIEKEEITGESEIIQNNMKNIQRGLEHRSFRQRDNYTYFGKRQPNNKKEINELADMELGKLEGQKKGNIKQVIIAKEKMEEYMNENTDIGKKLNFIPYDTGKFRKPKDEIVTKVSDRRETRPQTYFYLALGTIGAIKSAMTILHDHELMDQMYKAVEQATGKVTPEMAQNTINSVVNDMNSINGMKEYANLEGNNWDISSEQFQVSDASHHGFMEQFGQSVVDRISNIRNMCQTDPSNAMIEAYKLKKEVISNVPADQLQTVVKQHTQFWNGLPQNMQEVFANDAQTGKDAAMNLCDMMINGVKKSKDLTMVTKPGKIDLWGPIISAGATIGSFINNRRQGNIAQNQNKVKNENQNQR